MFMNNINRMKNLIHKSTSGILSTKEIYSENISKETIKSS